jgi:hypothetical protein
VFAPPTELALPHVSTLPLDQEDEDESLLPVVSVAPVPVVAPVLEDSDVPLDSDAPVDEPVVEDAESLPLTPALTLAPPTPGIPALTDPPAFQPSVWPAVSEALVPVELELLLDEPLVLDSELLAEVLSL